MPEELAGTWRLEQCSPNPVSLGACRVQGDPVTQLASSPWLPSSTDGVSPWAQVRVAKGSDAGSPGTRQPCGQSLALPAHLMLPGSGTGPQAAPYTGSFVQPDLFFMDQRDPCAPNTALAWWVVPEIPSLAPENPSAMGMLGDQCHVEIGMAGAEGMREAPIASEEFNIASADDRDTSR